MDNDKTKSNLLSFPDKIFIEDYAISTHIHNLIATYGPDKVKSMFELHLGEASSEFSEFLMEDLNVSSQKS